MLNIQFNEPKIVINNQQSDSFVPDFFLIEASVYFGTSEVSHSHVEKLMTLLANKRNEIDAMLESQSTYIIGPDFHEGSLIPHISCWVTKPLDVSLLRKLEELFDDEFEVIDCVITSVNENMGKLITNQNQ